MRFLMQYRTVVQLACQTHKTHPSGIFALQVPSLKVLSSCTIELPPLLLVLDNLLRTAPCFELQRTAADFYRVANGRLPGRSSVFSCVETYDFFESYPQF